MSKAAWLKSGPFLIGAAGLLAVAGVYLYGLSRPAGISSRESTFLGGASDLLPSVATLRIPAALVAIVSVLLMYALLNRWHSRRVAYLGSALFATTGWMLHTGRLALPLIIYTFMPLALLYLVCWLSATRHPARGLVGTAAAFAILLQIPGAIWFELACLILLRRVLVRHVRAVRPYVIVLTGLIALAAIGAVAFRLIAQPATVTRWFGAHNGLPEPMQFLDQWAHSVTFMFRGPEASGLWLGHAPVLDVFSMAILLLGALLYLRRWRNLRVYLLGSFAVIATLLIGLSGTTGLSYLIPIVYLVIGTGLTRLLHEWYVIFPRNPVARWIGTSVVTAAVLLACTYHLSAYFIAWQRSPLTQQTFQQRQ